MSSSLEKGTSLDELYQFNVQLCNPLITAVINTLAIQCSIPGKYTIPRIKTDLQPDRTDVAIGAAIITKNLLAQVTLCMKRETFFKVMGKMFGEDYAQFTPELEDAAKELMNIVFNQAKQPLAARGIVATRSIPQIIFGDSFLLSYITPSAMILPIHTEFGEIQIEITTQRANENGGA